MILVIKTIIMQNNTYYISVYLSYKDELVDTNCYTAEMI